MSLRAAGIEAFGDDVALLELPEPPALEAGQVLIDVKAAGVGNWEEFVRTGGWDVGRVPPLALGVEAAGEVVEVGPGVEWPAAGAPVMTHPLPLPYQGCWAERLVAPPDDIDLALDLIFGPLFYRLLKTDTHTRVLANPQLRASEGITAGARSIDPFQTARRSS